MACVPDAIPEPSMPSCCAVAFLIGVATGVLFAITFAASVLERVQ